MAQWPLEELFTQIDRGGPTGGKPFFLGDMRSQCRPQCAHCACSGPVASGKKFYTEVYSMDRGQIGPGWGGALAVQIPFFFFWQLPSAMFAWRLGSTIPFFFFWQLPSSHCPTGIYGPVARWRLEKNALPFFFFGSLGNVPPSVCKQKKQKILKKRCKKKVLLNRYYREKIPLFFF